MRARSAVTSLNNVSYGSSWRSAATSLSRLPVYCLSESANGNTITPPGPPAARMKRSVDRGEATSSARMRARVAGSASRCSIESTPPEWAHAGIEASSEVAPAR